MSHVTTVQTGVEFKDRILLEEALNGIGRVDTVIVDYYNKEIPVELAVHTQEFERGIGFIKQGDQYIPQLDSYGYVRQSEHVLKRIQQKYQQVAVTQFYRNKRFSVQVKEDEGMVRIHARGY